MHFHFHAFSGQGTSQSNSRASFSFFYYSNNHLWFSNWVKHVHSVIFKMCHRVKCFGICWWCPQWESIIPSSLHWKHNIHTAYKHLKLKLMAFMNMVLEMSRSLNTKSHWQQGTVLSVRKVTQDTFNTFITITALFFKILNISHMNYEIFVLITVFLT